MRFLAVVIVVTSIRCTVSAAQESKISPDLQVPVQASMVDIIVQFGRRPTPELHAKVFQLGGLLKRELSSIGSASYSVPVSSLQWLSFDDDVKHISPDRKVHMLLDNTTAAVNASAAWSIGLDGSGIGVAVIDSGISDHDDLEGQSGSRVVYRQSFVNGDTTDGYGHGEHVSGIVAGNGADSNCAICTRNFSGVAPGATLIDLQALDDTGEGSDSSVIAAIEEAIALQSQYNIRVINLSLGRPVYESYSVDPLCQAVEAAWQAGIVVVAAAGNDGRDDSVGNKGYGTIDAPGNDPYIITVGAMKTMGTPQRSDDLIASYSSRGPTQIDHFVKPDLVAPGNLVVSLQSPNGSLQLLYPQNLVPLTYYMSTNSTLTSTSYFTLSGTSMAAPVVSGAAALLLEAQPKLTPDQVKAKLMLTAYKTFPLTSSVYDPVTAQTYLSEYDVFTVGAGYLDIQAALADNTSFSGSALSPVALPYPKHGKGYIVCTSTTVCAATCTTGVSLTRSAQSIWGAQAILTTTRSIWTDQSIWDDQSIWSDGVLWGSQSIWTDQSVLSSQSMLASANIPVDGEP